MWQVSAITPPSYADLTTNGATRSPPSTAEAPSNAKRSLERSHLHRRKAGWPGGFASLATGPLDRTFDLAGICSFDLTKTGTQRYVTAVPRETI